MKPPEQLLSQHFRIALTRLKLMGVRIESSHTAPGFPDWVVFKDGQTYYFELKAGSPLTKAQIVFHKQLLARGIFVNVLTRIHNTVMMNGMEYSRLEQAIQAAIAGTTYVKHT